MRRRNIQLSRGGMTKRQATVVAIKAQIKEKFGDSPDAEKFIEYVVSSGWDMGDIDSFNTQAAMSGHASQRPPLQIFLGNNEHIFDQMFLNQGTYTHFRDTAAEPNYAIRHPGQTELMFRRITPGDTLMLNSAAILSGQLGADVCCSAESMPDYWQQIWRVMLQQLIPHDKRNAVRWLWDDLDAAMCLAFFFCENSMKYSQDAHDVHWLEETFFDPRSRFNVGVHLKRETRRIDGPFIRGVFIGRVDDRDESRAMAAVVLTCFAIDTYARATLDGFRTLSPGDTFYTIFQQHLISGNPPVYFKTEDPNADTEAPDEAGPEHTNVGFGSPRQG